MCQVQDRPKKQLSLVALEQPRNLKRFTTIIFARHNITSVRFEPKSAEARPRLIFISYPLLQLDQYSQEEIRIGRDKAGEAATRWTISMCAGYAMTFLTLFRTMVRIPVDCITQLETDFYPLKTWLTWELWAKLARQGTSVRPICPTLPRSVWVSRHLILDQDPYLWQPYQHLRTSFLSNVSNFMIENLIDLPICVVNTPRFREVSNLGESTYCLHESIW